MFITGKTGDPWLLQPFKLLRGFKFSLNMFYYYYTQSGRKALTFSNENSNNNPY